MGITGLIPFLEKASSRFHLRDLRGQCVAIDSYCWLHKGAFACADKLARGEQTDIHIQYCLKYVNMLLSHDIKPILVFDGRHLPAKAMTEAKRRETRDNSKKRAAELLRVGKTEEAKSYLRRCVDITHEMALQLIQECRKRNVDCVVAPYEADAQLAYLNQKNIAQAVITEDSDLMLFGCSKVLFKLDLTGSGLLIEAEKLYLAMGCKEEKYTFDKFRYMCILSGCDYLESLPGIGLAKARKFVLTTEDTDIRRALSKIPAYLNMRQLEVSEEYKLEFLKADATFKHMVVFDPLERKQTRLNEPEVMGTDPTLCCNAGSFLDDEMAFQMALGNLNPFTMKRLDNWHPDDPKCRATGGQTSNWKQTAVTKHSSIWKGSYQGRRSQHIEIHEEVKVRNVFQLEAARRSVTGTHVEETEKESIDDILQLYGIVPKDQEPAPKRFCLSTVAVQQKQTVNAEEIEEKSNLPRRNPFHVKSTAPVPVQEQFAESNALKSPLKITAENSSLLRQVSPVKKIEYDTKPILQLTSKTEKLSRFKRTVLGNDSQKVISRFFSTSSSSQLITTVSNLSTSPSADKNDNQPMLEIQEETSPVQTTSVYLLSPEARGEKTPKKQRPFPHNGSSSSPAPPVKGERSVEKLDSGFVEEPEEGFSSSQKENQSDEQQKPISRVSLFAKKGPNRLSTGCSTETPQHVEPTEENDVVEIKDDGDENSRDTITVSQKLAPSMGKSGSSSSQKKATCRRVGLSKKGVKDVGPNQSKLSMFGFQKKVQLK
ncbi:exonuclease 1 [Armigeres subalbatus]|uniref:exonuclease 1 n=1 Tax=Armigeres subalbatus TaxID=124917 RepID=UPI002ED56764